MAAITVETYDEQEAYWEALATELALEAALIDDMEQHEYDESTMPDTCPHCHGTGLVPAEDASHDPEDCIHCAPIDWDIQLALVEHQEIQQTTDCTGDPLDDDEPDDARDVTGWIDGREEYR